MTQKPETLPTHDVAGRFAAPIYKKAPEPGHREKEADALRLLQAEKEGEDVNTE